MDPIVSLDFSPDGEYIVTGESSGRVLLWRTNTLEILYTYTFPSRLWAVTYSKNQNSIGISGEQDSIHIVSGSNLGFSTSISTGHNQVYDIDFRYDSRTLLTCGQDKKAKIWNLTDLTRISDVSSSNVIYTCEYSSNNFYATAGVKDIDTYDTNDNQVYSYNNGASTFYGLRIRPAGDFSIACSADGKLI